MYLARPAWWLGYGTFGLVAYLFLFQVMLFCVEMGARVVVPRQAPALRSRRALLSMSAMAVATCPASKFVMNVTGNCPPFTKFVTVTPTSVLLPQFVTDPVKVIAPVSPTLPVHCAAI